METTAFDRLTRRFGARVNRRHLSLTSASLLALVGMEMDQDEISARRRCRRPGVKCKDACCRGQKVCRQGRCVTCQGFRCPDGRCVPQSCAGTCCPQGTSCCGGLCCPQGRTCCDDVCCAANETCVGQTCSPCTTLTDSCEVETRCGPNDDFRCATSAESGNFCVHFGFPCRNYTTDAECAAELGDRFVSIACSACPDQRACAEVLFPA